MIIIIYRERSNIQMRCCWRSYKWMFCHRYLKSRLKNIIMHSIEKHANGEIIMRALFQSLNVSTFHNYTLFGWWKMAGKSVLNMEREKSLQLIFKHRKKNHSSQLQILQSICRHTCKSSSLYGVCYMHNTRTLHTFVNECRCRCIFASLSHPNFFFSYSHSWSASFKWFMHTTKFLCIIFSSPNACSNVIHLNSRMDGMHSTCRL